MKGVLLGLLFCATLPACSLVDGDQDSSLRLVLYASPRNPPNDGAHLVLIGAEAVEVAGDLPQDPMCVRLSAQLGTFSSPTGGAQPEANPDGGADACPSDRCTFLMLPTGAVRREFAIYKVSNQMSPDIILGELYRLGDMDTCPPKHLPEPATSEFLTLDVPDVPLPAPPDLSASAPDLSAENDLSTAMSTGVDAGGGDL